MVKICYVGDAQNIHTQRWAEEFARRGYEVHVISTGGADLAGVQTHLLEPVSSTSAARSGVSHVAFLKSIVRSAIEPTSRLNGSLYRKAVELCDSYSWVSGDLAIARRCKGIVQNIRPDILHGHYLTRYAFYAACTGYKPLVVSPWGSDVFVNARKTFVARMYCKFAIRRADVVTAESKTMETALLGLGSPKTKIARFPWGIDCDLFSPTLKEQAMELKANLHIPATAPIILSNRNMKPLYNIDLIVRSFAHVLREFPTTILILLKGYGVDDYTQKILDEVDRSNLSNNVRIVTHLLTLKQMAVFLNASDILLSIPNSDSFPISVLEGMACGVIPILSDIEANRELITKGGNAVIVPSLDGKTLASKIVYCLRHLSDLASWKDTNRYYVLQYHNWQDSAKHMEDIYRQVLNGQGGHVRFGATRPKGVASE